MQVRTALSSEMKTNIEMVKSTIGKRTSSHGYSRHRRKGRRLCIGNAVSMRDETIYRTEPAPEQWNKMTMPVGVNAAASLHYASISLMILKMASNIVFVLQTTCI
jgi:hypothetical protein